MEYKQIITTLNGFVKLSKRKYYTRRYDKVGIKTISDYDYNDYVETIQFLGVTFHVFRRGAGLVMQYEIENDVYWILTIRKLEKVLKDLMINSEIHKMLNELE